MREPDLIELAAGPMLTPAQRRSLKPPCSKGARGHVAPPGTGPAGETCGSCRNLARRQFAKTYLKCWLNQAKWTGGGKSDVRAGDLACRRWQHKPHLIVATFVYPPIPIRTCDWQAHYDNDEPDDDGRMVTGEGRTEWEAVLDLIDNHPRPDVFCPERGR